MTTIPVPDRIAEAVPVVSGNPETVAGVADVLRRASVAFDDLDTTAGDNKAPSGWEGDAAAAYGARVDEVAVDAETTSLTLRAAASAVDDYADELVVIKLERDRLVGARSGYHTRRSGLLSWIDTAQESEVSALLRESEALVGIRDVLIGEIDAMVVAERTNDQNLRTALSRFPSMAAARVITNGGDPADKILQRTGAPGTGATPEEVAAWWDKLSDDERDAVMAASPEVIGSADGLPTTVRDEANRLLLTNDLDTLEQAEKDGTITWEQQQVLKNARAAEAGLTEAAKTIDPITGESSEAFLHLYDPRAFHGDGTVAISVGNPDTADNVTTLVPGMNTTAADAQSYAEAAGNIMQSARLSGAGSTASMFWIGYDHPSDTDVGNVISQGASTDGGEWLAKHVAGLQAARGDDQPHMTVVGHSYGSNTMAHAATDWGLDVDDLVFIGSPGAGSADGASDLGDAKVWVGNASRDPVAKLADNGWINLGTVGLGLGNDVAEEGFGAVRFQAEHPARLPDIPSFPVLGDPLGAGRPLYDFFGGIPDHVRYWEPGSESLYNIGLIVGGQEDGNIVTAKPTYDPFFGGVVDPEFDRSPTWYSDRVQAETNGP